jgi:hypoxanthine phosphoribosyltransferase
MRVLIATEALERRVAELAAQIDADYLTVPVRRASQEGGAAPAMTPATSVSPAMPGIPATSAMPAGEAAAGAEGSRRAADDPLIAVGVLKGSIFFFSDLLKRLTVPVVIDFLQAASYGSGGARRGELRIAKDVGLRVAGRDVLLVEDIVDSGHTARALLDLLGSRGARSVRLCTLLDKSAMRQVEVPIDYRGFPIDNHFVVGYGLDHDERWRNLPYIAVWEPDAG